MWLGSSVCSCVSAVCSCHLSVMKPPTKENKKAAPTVAAVMPDSQSSACSEIFRSFHFHAHNLQSRMHKNTTDIYL